MVLEQDIKASGELDNGTLPSVTEQLFWRKNAKEWKHIGYRVQTRPACGPSLDLRDDSYIIAFCGPRGSGKTLTATYMAMKAAFLYNKRLISNYEIAFKLKRMNGDVTIHRSEPLDMYKLLCFDNDYENSLIIIDEAPQVINRLATMTWKNRLLALWLQQIRKERNSLFYMSQNENWVDGELRWQTDIRFHCRDVSRFRTGIKRGTIIEALVYDKSGMWTGVPRENMPIGSVSLYGADRIWPCFDSYKQFDVMESLRKVEMKVGKYQIGESDNPNAIPFTTTPEIQQAINTGIKLGQINRNEFFDSCGISDVETKKKITSWLKQHGVEVTGNNKYQKLCFGGFNPENELSMGD